MNQTRLFESNIEALRFGAGHVRFSPTAVTSQVSRTKICSFYQTLRENTQTDVFSLSRRKHNDFWLFQDLLNTNGLGQDADLIVRYQL